MEARVPGFRSERSMGIFITILSPLILPMIPPYMTGVMLNSMFLYCEIAYYKVATNRTYFSKNWNLFWRNGRDYEYSEPSEDDVFGDPLFQASSYRISQNSPAVNAGDPSILDLDGTRSDIGVYGGPYAYR